MKSIVIFFGLAFLSVSGCVNFSPMSDPSRFFTLMPLPQVEQSQGRGRGEINNMFLGIGPIQFPAYLDREQIVTRTAQNRLDISENDRWAEPLEENFTRVLSQNLGILLGGARIIRYPWRTSQSLGCQIEIEVLRFEPNTGQKVAHSTADRDKIHGSVGRRVERDFGRSQPRDRGYYPGEVQDGRSMTPRPSIGTV